MHTHSREQAIHFQSANYFPNNENKFIGCARSIDSWLSFISFSFTHRLQHKNPMKDVDVKFCLRINFDAHTTNQLLLLSIWFNVCPWRRKAIEISSMYLQFLSTTNWSNCLEVKMFDNFIFIANFKRWNEFRFKKNSMMTEYFFFCWAHQNIDLE